MASNLHIKILLACILHIMQSIYQLCIYKKLLYPNLGILIAYYIALRSNGMILAGGTELVQILHKKRPPNKLTPIGHIFDLCRNRERVGTCQVV